MKILILNDYGTPTGGAELMSLTLRDGLRARGYDARFFSSSAKPLDEANAADYRCFGTTSSFRTLLQSSNPMAAYTLRQVVDEFRPDIIHVRMFLTQLSPLILPVLRNVKSLLHVVNYRPICPTNLKLLPDGKVCRHQYGTACYREGCLPLWDWLPLMFQMKLWELWRGVFSLIVTNSHSVRRLLAQNGLRADLTIWNGVPVTRVRPPLKTEPIVVYAGRLEPKKGVNVLLRAMGDIVRLLPRCRLLVAGDGSERSRLERYARDLGLDGQISFLGHISRPQLEKAFGSAWVQVIPSLWEEPFGLVAAEAMMRGSAVVVSSLGGLSEIVQHGKTGFQVTPGCSKALSKTLMHVLTDRQRAEAMGMRAREYALRELAEERMLERFIATYQKLLIRQKDRNRAKAMGYH